MFLIWAKNFQTLWSKALWCCTTDQFQSAWDEPCLRSVLVWGFLKTTNSHKWKSVAITRFCFINWGLESFGTFYLNESTYVMRTSKCSDLCSVMTQRQNKGFSQCFCQFPLTFLHSVSNVFIMQVVFLLLWCCRCSMLCWGHSAEVGDCAIFSCV